MKSPDHSHELRLDPGVGHRHAWWRVSGHTPYWVSSFSGSAPVEVVAAATDALIRPDGESGAPLIVDLLTDARWQRTLNASGGDHLTSPDETIVVELLLSDVSDRHQWFIDVADHHDRHGPQQRLWSARLDSHAPAVLLAAVAGALIDPAPVLRTRFATSWNQRLDAGPEFEIRDAVVAAHTQRLAAARRHRLKNSAGSAAPAPAVTARAVQRR